MLINKQIHTMLGHVGLCFDHRSTLSIWKWKKYNIKCLNANDVEM